MSELPRIAKDAKQQLDRELRLFVRKRQSLPGDPGLKPLVDYLAEIEDFILRDGKRLRGFLVLVGHRLAGGKTTRSIFTAAAAIELVHAYALLHDDLIDRDVLRRHRPTFHVRYTKRARNQGRRNPEHYGTSQTISAGDYVAGLAVDLVSELDFPDTNKVQAAQVITETAIETCVGEAEDIWFSYQKPRTVAASLQTLMRKSAYYTAVAPLLFGATLHTPTYGNKKLLTQYGQHLGLAFQLRDDWLSICSTTASNGKDFASDVREAKNTILASWAAQEMSALNKKHFLALLHRSRKSRAALHQAQKMISATKAPQKVDLLAKKHARSAMDIAIRLTDDQRLQKVLLGLAQAVVERER